MTTTRALRTLLTFALLAAASAHGAGDAVLVGTEDGKSVAEFKVGDSNCEFIDGRIRCTLGR
jgi:hypothetical protein